MSLPFTGSGVALVTPFGDDGVNERVLGELVEFHVREGTDALVVCGSTGEAATMAPAEQRKVIEIAVEAAGGRIPVVGGVGGSDTRAVEELARGVRGAGADGLLVSSPPYNKPTQEGMIAHFRAVIGAADLPAIIYNIPGRTACNVLPETVDELAGDPRVVGVKEASGDISQIAELCGRLADRLAIYSGNDDQVIPILALGGRGVISVVANLVPAEISRMVHLFLAGEVEQARAIQFRYLPLIQALFRDPNPVPVKTGVKAMGFDAGGVRLPLVEITDSTLGILRDRMLAAGISAQVEV